MTREQRQAIDSRVLDTLAGIGGGTTRDAIWSSMNIVVGEQVLMPKDVGASLLRLRRRGLAYNHDGHGTLVVWGGISRGSWWSTRETLERDYGHGAAELPLGR